MNGSIAGNPRRIGPGWTRLGARVPDDLEQQSIGITEADDLLGLTVTDGAPHRPLMGDAMPNEALDPEADRARQHGEGRHRHLSGAHPPAAGPRPGEERHDAARRANLVAVVQM